MDSGDTDPGKTEPGKTEPGKTEPIGLLGAVGEALIGVRRAKTDAKASQKTEIGSATVTAPAKRIALLRLAEADLKAVGRIRELRYTDGAEFAVSDVVLVEPDPPTT